MPGPWLAVTCPTVNSYKRMGAPAPDSGATWAPAYVAYGGNNRTHMLRVPEPGRVENAVGRRLRQSLSRLSPCWPPPGWTASTGRSTRASRTSDDLFASSPSDWPPGASRTMPPTLLHAVEALGDDAVLREALGKTPDGEYIDYFVKVKAKEFMDFHAPVTPWEVEHYLTPMIAETRPVEETVHSERGSCVRHRRVVDRDPALEPQLGPMVARMARRGPGRRTRPGLPLRAPIRAGAESVHRLCEVDRVGRRARRLGAGTEVVTEWPSPRSLLGARGRGTGRPRPSPPGLAARLRRSRSRSSRTSGRPRRSAGATGVDCRATGYQGIGHTRMATESAVTAAPLPPVRPRWPTCAWCTTARSPTTRPSAGGWQAKARQFDTDNDSEVAARYLARPAGRRGRPRRRRSRCADKEMDGFFTLLVTTADAFAVVRDSFACKPAVVAETDDYVADGL